MKRALPVVRAVLVLLALLAPARAQAPDPLAREREEQTGTAITILFDNSGSMRGEKIRQAKAAFLTWLQQMPADYKLGLITFEGSGNLVVPLGAHTRDRIAQKVAQLVANTSTPICGALHIARREIEKRRREVTPYERHVVLIFTDGEETVDSRGINGVREDIVALRKETVEVVGVGFHGEGDYMKDVATRFALANNEQELQRGLAKVDAEIGRGDDLVVTPSDLAALRKMPPAPLPSAAAPAAAAAVPEPAPDSPSAPTAKSRGFQVRWFVVLVLAYLVIRRLLSKRARS